MEGVDFLSVAKSAVGVVLFCCLFFIIFIAGPYLEDRIVRKARKGRSIFNPLVTFDALKIHETYALTVLICIGLVIFALLMFIRSLGWI